MTSRASRRRPRGFTLIEVMVVMTIAAVMLGIGMPALQELLVDQRVRGAASDLMSDITFARAKAIENSRRVYIQRTGTDWKDGWRVFVDLNGNNSFDANEILLTNIGLEGRLRVCSTVAELATNIIFRPDGRIVRTTAGATTDGIYVVDELGDADIVNNKMRALLFTVSGRVTNVKMNAIAPPC